MTATDIKDKLLTEARQYLDHGRKVVTIDGKKPTLVAWTPLRDVEISIEKVRAWLSSSQAERIAVVLDKSLLAFDYDGAGEHVIWDKLVPRCSPELQDAFHKTTLTKTPNGGHVLFGIDASDFPEGLREIQCWWNGKNHNQVILLSQNKYLIERGLGYEAIRGIDYLVILTKPQVSELMSLLQLVRLETTAIKTSVDILLQYYYNTNRDNLTFGLSGFLHKYGGFEEYLIKDIQEYLMDIAGIDTEQERQERFNVIRNTCVKDRKSVSVSGREKLLEAVSNDENVLITIQNAFRPLGYFEGNDSVRDTNKSKRGKGDKNGNRDDSDQEFDESIILLEELHQKRELNALFVDKHDAAFSAIMIDGHREILPIKSSRFRRWICKRYFETRSEPIKSETLKQICDLLEAQALFSNNVKDLQLRTSSSDSDVDNIIRLPKCSRTIYYDLTDKMWQAVRISQYGWNIEKSTDVPILFRRHSNQLPQVAPSRKYPIDIFDQFMNLINVKDGNNRLLLKCYIISLFIPEIPKPVLMLHGEQGSAKSTLQELIKRVVDPSSIANLTFPRDVNELVQQLSHNYIAYYDNVSIIRDWISDQICRAVTGLGFSKRELWTNDDDIIYNFRRCLGFNGINLAATKADLLDRGLIIQLERIPKENRRKIQEIWDELDKIKPCLLGYIFDVIVKVLEVKNNGGISIDSRSRMADFEEYAEITSRCIGHKPYDFINAYYNNQQLQTDAVVEGSPVATAIIKLLDKPNYNENGWCGTATDLLSELESYALEFKINTKSKFWVKSANSLSHRLNQIRTNMRDLDIEITYTKDVKTRVKIWKINRTVKYRSDRSDRSEGENRAQNVLESANYVSNDHSDVNKRSFRDNSQNHAQNQGTERLNDVNDVTHRTISSESSEPLNKDTEQTSNEAYDFVPSSGEMKFHSGYWHCEKCKEKGDKFYMEDHKCSSKKEDMK